MGLALEYAYIKTLMYVRDLMPERKEYSIRLCCTSIAHRRTERDCIQSRMLFIAFWMQLPLKLVFANCFTFINTFVIEEAIRSAISSYNTYLNYSHQVHHDCPSLNPSKQARGYHSPLR